MNEANAANPLLNNGAKPRKCCQTYLKMFNIQFEITNGCFAFTNRSSILVIFTTANIIWIVLTMTGLNNSQDDDDSGKTRKKHLSSLEEETEWYLFFQIYTQSSVFRVTFLLSVWNFT